MAIKPEDIIDVEREVEKWEEKIDDALRINWDGVNPVIVELPDIFPTIVIERLKILYSRWNVIHNIKRDGSYNLSFNAKLDSKKEK